MRLPKEAFLALAALGWADGQLDENEGVALLRAAREAGLSEGELEEIKGATEARVELGALPVSRMSRADRVLTYALAVWLIRLDGVVTTEEKMSLRTLGNTLELPDGVRSRISAAAFEVASLPQGDRPERYDFQALQGRLRAKLGDLDGE
jgi:uncharacterized membrane protein YebE (DUF533 family)